MVRLHLESVRDASGRSQQVPIYRANPVMLEIDKTAFLTEESVREAAVIDVVGGFAIEIKFKRQGVLILDQISGANKGRRIAVFGALGIKDGKPEQARWLAAPKITRPIADGVLVFTPDATREEADQFVLGLRNAAKKYKDLFDE